MKQYLLALALAFSIHAVFAGVQPRHRHHPQTEQTVTAQGHPSTIVSTSSDSTGGEGIEAYSDTTDTAMAESVDTTYTSSQGIDNFSYSGEFHDLLRNLVGGTIGLGGVIIAILVILIILLFLLAPFVVLILLFRYLINRHNNRVSLAEKAMETGQPIPDDLKMGSSESPDYYWKKGIKNTSIGLGLLVMFSILGSEVLMGVGALIALWGAGQMIIAKTTK